MDSSSLSKIKVHYRPDLWYGCYDQCIRIWLHEAPCLRDISKGHDRIKSIIQRRRDWGRRMVASLNKQPGSWQWQNLDITDQDEKNLLDMLGFLQSATAKHRKVISGDWMYFYSSDTSFIDSIESLPFLEKRDRIQRGRIEIRGNPGTVSLQESAYRYRSYLRGYMRLSDQQADALSKYLQQQPDLRLGPALSQWVTDARKYYIGDYFFIDHNDMGLVTMLSLMVPRIIRRTKPIETAK